MSRLFAVLALGALIAGPAFAGAGPRTPIGGHNDIVIVSGPDGPTKRVILVPIPVKN